MFSLNTRTFFTGPDSVRGITCFTYQAPDVSVARQIIRLSVSDNEFAVQMLPL